MLSKDPESRPKSSTVYEGLKGGYRCTTKLTNATERCAIGDRRVAVVYDRTTKSGRCKERATKCWDVTRFPASRSRIGKSASAKAKSSRELVHRPRHARLEQHHTSRKLREQAARQKTSRLEIMQNACCRPVLRYAHWTYDIFMAQIKRWQIELDDADPTSPPSLHVPGAIFVKP